MKHILIVDDEPHITKSLHRELQPWRIENNIEILLSNDPMEVPLILKNNKDIFLLLTDMMMPKLNGADLSKIAKDINPDILIIIMTGYAQIDVVVKAVGSGISALITKPWNIQHLLLEIENVYQTYTLKQKEKEYINKIEEEVRWGGEIQKRLLNRELPEYMNISFSVLYEPLPSLYCGGDYYDIIPLSENRFFLICADVAGHGIKAAFITTILKSIIYSGYVVDHKENMNPASFLSWLNNRLIDELISCPDVLITVSAFYFNLNDYTLIYSNAGHLPSYIINNSEIREIYRDGVAMNFTGNIHYKNKSFSLNKGDKIISFTDGLIEIGRDKQMLNSSVIRDQLLKSYKGKEEVHSLYNRFRLLSEMGSFHDDVTIITVELI